MLLRICLILLKVFVDLAHLKQQLERRLVFIIDLYSKLVIFDNFNFKLITFDYYQLEDYYEFFID